MVSCSCNERNSKTVSLTKRLRGIWHAWHFQFALSLVVTALCGSFCSACLHPLTQR
ncbi:DUF3265 domain-containing protein [Vibrio vulnificus]|nr:DUF3265 domain-containing protein [Vibrio vulnificus]MCA0785732.1 DUF3265 domain-containing protein [Vibrio vulnificus]OZS51045.1 DUF3265 domain-containing protein [Vibrio vulnificus]OZS55621.1 DUF3265 domain-containing protein [Vibrio vulnificus]OZS60338.1 DUF3265 domain-containing protein [Vibrio vulnificus]